MTQSSRPLDQALVVTRGQTFNKLVGVQGVVLSIKSVLGEYRAFFSLQLGRLKDIRIDISGCELSHLAFGTETYDEYLQTRERIERHCTSNIENIWNGRPISIMQLKQPLDLGEGFGVGVIELIPPVHRRVYKMGSEHVGVVIGDRVDEFSHKHRAELTGYFCTAPGPIATMGFPVSAWIAAYRFLPLRALLPAVNHNRSKEQQRIRV